MSEPKGFAPWNPGISAPYLAEVLEVMKDQQDLWPLTQRYWLYRLIAKKGWGKYDEYKKSKAKPKEQHLCTQGKNLNLILNRGRRAGLIPWEAVSGGRGAKLPPQQSSSAKDLVWLVERVISDRQLNRQAGQGREIVLWMETEGMVPLIKSTAHYYGATVLAGKGFDTLTNKHEFAESIARSENVLILHAGDLDKSGHTLYISLEEDLQAFVRTLGGELELKRIALTEQQAIDFDLETTPAPLGLNKGNHGSGFTSSVECQLEALDAPDIKNIIERAFESELDMDLYHEQVDAEDDMKREALQILLTKAEGNH